MELGKNINIRIVLIVILSFILGWQLGHKDVEVKIANSRPSINVTSREVKQKADLDFKLFWDTWELVSKTYFDKKTIDPQKLYYGAISGMVSALGDPYTVFLPPEQQKSSKEELNGSFEGVGIQLGFNKDKRLVVVAPLSGTPAARSGVKPGDLIVKIGEEDTTNITLPQAVEKIRGKKGTEITLTIFSEGDSDTRPITLKRDTIIIKSVEVSYQTTDSGKKVAVVKLSRFGERTYDEWNQTVDELLLANSQAVVLDLRNNPGGFLEGAVYIASEFLDSGNVVLQQNSEGKKTAFPVNRPGKLTKIPLMVLINKGSASASEIVAGALQDRKRAKLLGEESFGKGTIQEAQDLQEGAGIHITVAKWLTPNSRWVNDTQGLVPDVKIEADKNLQTDDLSDDKKDLQLIKAVELLS